MDSLLAQTFQHWEAIIVNDGSTDDTLLIAEKYLQNDSRFHLINQRNAGLSNARNTGLEKAIGQRLIFLDADDYISHHGLSEISNALSGADEYTLIQYGYTYVSEDKKRTLRSVLPKHSASLFPNIFYEVPGPCNSICISSELKKKIGIFDIRLKSLEDWDFWIRAAKCGASVKYLDVPLVYYRYVNNSMSRNAFVMYHSFKEVAQRASKKDDRIAESALNNNKNDYDNSLTIQNALLRMLGVSIMQGKISESVVFFEKETSIALKDITIDQFDHMCSYLTFRYWYQPMEIKEVLEVVRPRFDDFFSRFDLTDKHKNKILFVVFKRHLFIHNINKFGNVFGRVKNYFLRIKYLY